MALDFDSDLFGTAAPSDAPLEVPAAAEDVDVLAQESLPGVTEELLAEIFYGEIPEAYTKASLVEQAIVYVTDLVERNGSCILRGWPNWLYHSLPFISSTLLKGYYKLPSTCRTPWTPTDDANMGSGQHAYTLLGEQGLKDECFFLPASCEGKSKAALAEREMYAQMYPMKSLLPPVYGPEKVPALDIILGVDREFRSHPKTSLILANSEKELSLVWVDEGTGCTCKVRLDIWEEKERAIWDLKKSRDLDGFHWQIKDLCYGIQAGLYFTGAVACGLGPVTFGFLPFESFPPYQVGCGYRDPDKLIEDCAEATRLIGLVKESQMKNRWPNFRAPAHLYSWDDLKPDDTVDVY